MASVNFEKLKTKQQVKAMFRHCDKSERAKIEHSNKQINRNLIKTNLQYKRDYQTTCKLLDDRLDYLDTIPGQNKRKDRVICFGLEIPYPEDLKSEDEVKWINEVNKIIQNRYGSKNVMNAYIHRDEKHEYVDSETGAKRQSRNHIHVYVVPADENEKLNGKAFSSKKNMKSLNQEIHKMTQEQFGIDFMDGTKKKSKESVESLKQRSLIAEKVAEQVAIEKERLEREYAEREKTYQQQLVSQYQDAIKKKQEALQDAFQHKEDMLEAQFRVRVEEEVAERVKQIEKRRNHETVAY